MEHQLHINYAGLSLRTPIIVGSSGLTDKAEKNARWAEAGAGAIVLKSLFEEQIALEAATMEDPTAYGEGSDYMGEYLKQHKLTEYLDLIADSKRLCQGVPVIASVNCSSDSSWVDFAVRMQQAGADALEVNIMTLNAVKDYQPGAAERMHEDVLTHLRQHVNIPIIMKLAGNFTNPVWLIDRLAAKGASGIVLFNRPYSPDIDIDKLKHTSGDVFTTASHLSASLRWVGIASAAVPRVDYAVSGGVTDGKGVIKALLAGATAVEVCSALYKEGAPFISAALESIKEWMKGKNFDSLSQCKGLLSVKNVAGVNTFERTQFMRYFSSHGA